ncbi:uncharacterized protein TNCV_2018861 [Trichonephila clavipes]|nr:uncharacterized protein TNCV_2018861 [Trichonephila clavipes]
MSLNSDGKLRIWRQAYEAMVGTVQEHGGSIMVRAKQLCPLQVLVGYRLGDEHSSDFSVMNWPPRSPDLNPIEHLWGTLEQDVEGHHTAPTNLTELWTALANIWLVIPVERFQKFVESMPHRGAAFIKARGSPTRY